MSPKERQPPSNHDIELAPQASCWTPERLELKAWLTRNAPSLAELYEGAICLLFEHRLPGYTRFVTHAAREIANRAARCNFGCQLCRKITLFGKIGSNHRPMEKCQSWLWQSISIFRNGAKRSWSDAAGGRNSARPVPAVRKFDR